MQLFVDAVVEPGSRWQVILEGDGPAWWESLVVVDLAQLRGLLDLPELSPEEVVEGATLARGVGRVEDPARVARIRELLRKATPLGPGAP